MPCLPDNPFTPGAGLAPAYMGRRSEVEGELLRILGALRDRRPGARAALLFGPRGNGKTVLLNWLEKQAGGDDGGKLVAVVRFSSRDLGDAGRMREAIRRAASQWTSPWTRLTRTLLTAKVSIPPFSVQVDSGEHGTAPALQDWLAKGRGPLLLTVDEAHVAEPRGLGDFLDAVQIAGRTRPLAVVLAGTPDVLATLHAAHSSFWSRFRKLRVGLLGDEAARAVVAEPFHAAGLATDDGAVAALAKAADNYPYFLQIHGEAAWDAMAAAGERRLNTDQVPAILDSVGNQRRMHYSDRFTEFLRQNLLPLARDVALAFRSAPERRLSLTELVAVVTRHGDNPGELQDFLAAKGYIWQDADGSAWTPGIPSLMDYILEQTEP